ncbi:MAG TPA: beta-ketoacyl-[acyl-carrier-protein] synthase family protein [Actinomycetota bacterium]|nr:beta-ketoacyl-[acyl-carrier-protein] synthase family protein [Actinomycetota bacterium]
MTPQRVVVTGLGVASCLGCDVEEFWSRLTRGESGVVILPDEAFMRLPTRIGGVVQGYEPADHFDRKELRRLSRSSQLALVAASQAVRQAGLSDTPAARDAAVLIGSSIGGFAASDHFFRDYYQRGWRGPLVIPTSMNTAPSSNVSIRFGLGGPLVNVDAACASAAHSVGFGSSLIRSGTVDVAVVGGADSPFTLGVMEGWCALRVLSERNDAPAEACRPFSADRDGLVLGEGAGVMVLEAETSARRRGAPILAEILGYGAAADCHHLTHSSPDGAARAMQKALRDAGVRPDQIRYVNAHGTGTPLNDRNETAAIKQVFGPSAHGAAVVSNKAALGHTVAASGALELIGCVMTLRDRVVPPTLNRRVPDPECDLDYVTGGRRAFDGEYILSNSFAFGGSNAALVVGRLGP